VPLATPDGSMARMKLAVASFAGGQMQQALLWLIDQHQTR
jgi:hypothetical protein